MTLTGIGVEIDETDGDTLLFWPFDINNSEAVFCIFIVEFSRAVLKVFTDAILVFKVTTGVKMKVGYRVKVLRPLEINNSEAPVCIFVMDDSVSVDLFSEILNIVPEPKDEVNFKSPVKLENVKLFENNNEENSGFCDVLNSFVIDESVCVVSLFAEICEVEPFFVPMIIYDDVAVTWIWIRV